MKRAGGLLAFILFVVAAPAGATIRYQVSLAHPDEHWLRITMTIPHAQSGMIVAMPAWNALYQIRDFSYRVEDVHASLISENDGGAAPLKVTKLTKDTWSLAPPGKADGADLPGEARVEYRIYWDDAGPFNTQLNTHHAFVNFAEILFYIPDRRGEDTQAAFADVPDGWKAVAELPAGDQRESFSAASYDALVDAPVELGNYDEAKFDENGAHFRVVIDGGMEGKAALLDGLHKITRYETTMMGGAPFNEYTFFFHIGPYAQAGSGGMEHMNSTAISAGSVNGALRTAAHEFFHLWNVKRIRPQSLQPVDYSREQWTRALWFAEGVTSTYESLVMERTGLWTREEFYNDLASQISELDSRPARLWKSVEESSLDAWLEKYDFYWRPDASISYYNKGQILGDMLDLTIRDARDDAASLDDVMRSMNAEYAQRGRFYDDSDGVREVAEEVAGRSLADFFERYVAGTAEIPYNDFLGLAGLQLRATGEDAADIGFTTGRSIDGHAVVEEMEPGGPAEGAGVEEGDALLTINGESFPQFPLRWMRDHVRPGQKIKLTIERGGAQKQVEFTAATQMGKHYEIVEIPNATEKQARIREGWLKGTSN